MLRCSLYYTKVLVSVQDGGVASWRIDTEFLCQEQGPIQYLFKMVQGHTQEDSRGKGGWHAFGHGDLTLSSGRSPGICTGIFFPCPYIGGDTHEQWASYQPEEPNLPRTYKVGRETGGPMLSVTGLNHFYYVRDFTDMRCSISYTWNASFWRERPSLVRL